jgi:hypothetical protein
MKAEFPEVKFTLDKGKHLISIAPKHPDVGSIDIQDDDDEITVFIGNFTHWHVGCYEDKLSETQKAKSIAEDIAEFLQNLFDDKIIMWGCHEKGGGFYVKGNKPNSKSWLGTQHKEWVWSGPVHKI